MTRTESEFRKVWLCLSKKQGCLGISATGDPSLFLNQQGNWVEGSGGSSLWTLTGNDIYNSNSGNVGIGITSPTSKLDGLGDYMWTEAISGESSNFQIGKNALGVLPFDGLYTNKIGNKNAFFGHLDPRGFGSPNYLAAVVYNTNNTRANGLVVNENQLTLAEFDAATDTKQYGFTAYGIEEHADMFCYDLATDTDISSIVCAENHLFIRYYQDYTPTSENSTIITMDSTGILAGTVAGRFETPSTVVWKIDTNSNFIFPSIGTYADDAAAATGGVPVNGVYRETGTGYLKARIS